MPTLTFKATVAEERAIREAARRRNLNVSAYLRSMALPRNAALPKSRVVRSPRTGAFVISAAAGTPVLTSGKVRDLLASFP
jgi:hypothetical protein